MYSRQSGRISPAPSKTEVSDRLAKALTEAAPTAKHVARETGASIDSSESWRAGAIPSGYNVILLGRQYPIYGLEVAALMGINIDSPQGYALFLEMQLRMTRGT